MILLFTLVSWSRLCQTLAELNTREKELQSLSPHTHAQAYAWPQTHTLTRCCVTHSRQFISLADTAFCVYVCFIVFSFTHNPSAAVVAASQREGQTAPPPCSPSKDTAAAATSPWAGWKGYLEDRRSEIMSSWLLFVLPFPRLYHHPCSLFYYSLLSHR